MTRFAAKTNISKNVVDIIAVQDVGDKNVENVTQVLSLFKTVKGQIHKKSDVHKTWNVKWFNFV